MEEIKIITYVLDDDKDDLQLLEPYLVKVCGCNLQLYTDVEEFIQAIEKGCHIAIIDHMISSRIDGIEVGKRVLQKNPIAFLILYSGSSNSKVWQRATNNGFRGLIDKSDKDCFEQIANMVFKEMAGIKDRINEWNTLNKFNNKYKKYLHEV